LADIKGKKEQRMAMLDTLLPGNREYVGRIMAELDDALRPDNERREIIKATFNNHEKSVEMSEARIRRIMNNIEATTMGASFFEMEVLGESDFPIYVVETEDKCLVLYIGENGKPPKRQWVPSETAYQVPLNWLSSDEINYPLVSIYTGNLGAFERVNKRIERDLAYQRDVNCQALLDAGAAASFATGVLSAHRLVDSDNLPTGNYLDQSAEGSLTINVFYAILEYADKVGMAIKSIHIPSSQMGQMRKFVSLVAAVSSTGDVEKPSLTVPESVRTELWRTGKITNMFGQEIDIVGHNTLALNYGYVAMSEPAGYMPVKPSMDMTILDDSKDKIKKNLNSLMAKKVEAYYMPAPNRKNFIKFRFA